MDNRRPPGADPSTIQDKLLVGYRGWFACPGDEGPIDSDHHGWHHWFNGSVGDDLRPNIDILPDVSEYDRSKLYKAPGLRTKNGEQCYVFSSRDQSTVDRHFKLMADYGVDGAFLQKSIRERTSRIHESHDETSSRVRKAAEKHGRVFAISYDVSGVKPGEIEEIVLNDYIFKSPNYLKEGGKPVVALSGFQFGDSGHTPNFVHLIASHIRKSYQGGLYLIAGVPADWQTPRCDAAQDLQFFHACFAYFDAILPCTVGAYNGIQFADDFAAETTTGDMHMIKSWRELGMELDYIPVVFPGWSRHNSSDGKQTFDHTWREGGKLLWRQIYNARKHGARTIYAATWDGYDDGTALMPMVTSEEHLPWPVIATHQEELSLPVIIVHQNQVPVDITVAPTGPHQSLLNIFVTTDTDQPPLPGVILHDQEILWDNVEPSQINTVIITHWNQSPGPICPQDQGPQPIIIRHQHQQPPSAFARDQQLVSYHTDKDQLPFSIHTQYKFLAPGAPNSLPSDWYMRICGIAAEILHNLHKVSEAFPQEDLDRYWATRPYYEDSTGGGLSEELPPYNLVQEGLAPPNYEATEGQSMGWSAVAF